jgi:hypothetical protein
MGWRGMRRGEAGDTMWLQPRVWEIYGKNVNVLLPSVWSVRRAGMAAAA